MVEETTKQEVPIDFADEDESRKTLKVVPKASEAV
jgi:hypothetical protein